MHEIVAAITPGKCNRRGPRMGAALGAARDMQEVSRHRLKPPDRAASPRTLSRRVQTGRRTDTGGDPSARIFGVEDQPGFRQCRRQYFHCTNGRQWDED